MNLENYKRPSVSKSRVGEWWQEVGKEISTFYGKNCYWVFWKYQEQRINRAFHMAQKAGDRDFSHFIQNIKT